MRVRLLAVDPSLRHGGHCTVEGDPWNEGDPPYGWKAEDVASYVVPRDFTQDRCFFVLKQRIYNLILTRKPQAVIIEGPGGVDANPRRSLMTAHVLAGARAACQIAAYEGGVPSFLPFAGKIKASLGSHASSKKEEVTETLRRLKLYWGSPGDEADACAVAWYGMMALRAGEIILPEGVKA